jgi:hypothetical protein
MAKEPPSGAREPKRRDRLSPPLHRRPDPGATASNSPPVRDGRWSRPGRSGTTAGGSVRRLRPLEPADVPLVPTSCDARPNRTSEGSSGAPSLFRTYTGPARSRYTGFLPSRSRTTVGAAGAAGTLAMNRRRCVRERRLTPRAHVPTMMGRATPSLGVPSFGSALAP